MEWKEVKLGSLCNISSSKRIFASEYQETGIPFYRGKEIIEKQKGSSVSNELYISVDRYNAIKEKHGVPQKGDMLLTSVGTLGIPYIIGEEKFYFKDGNLTWFTQFNNLDVSFLYYWFLSPFGKCQIDSKAIGSTQKALTIDTLSKFDIQLPSIKDQRRIANILSSLDRKIELNNKINAQLEEMAQTLFKHWFVDFGPFKDGKFVESELGMIPEGWRVGTLGELASFSKKSINPGKTPETIFSHYSLPAFDESKYPALQKGAEIMSNKFVFEGETTLISKLNPHIKRVWFVDKVLENPICSTEFIPIKANNECNAAFIHCCINSDYYFSKAVSGVNGATTSHQRIHPEDLMNIQIAINEDQIRNFSKTVYPLLKKMSDVIVENRKLASLRDTLLPKLMSGEINLEDYGGE